MVGIVVVSHSDELARGAVVLARELGGLELRIEPAGGIEEAGVLGTDSVRVREAIERAMSGDGVLVLMDLGSALMSAELAVELLEDPPGRVLLSEAPIVEGAVAAAVAAAGGAPLEEVAAVARGALAMKSAQLGSGSGPSDLAPPRAEAEREAAPASAVDASATVVVRNEIGLHARPAARFVDTARRFDASVRVAKGQNGDLVSARSLTAVVALGARFGDVLRVEARGPQALEAIDALRALAETGFGDGVPSRPVPAEGNGQPAAVQAPMARAAEPAPAEAEPGQPGAGEPVPAEPEPGEPGPGEPVPGEPEPGAVLTGIAAARGLVAGPAHQLHGDPGPPPDRPPGTPDAERARLHHAIIAARAAIETDRETVAARAGRAEAEIFDAHLALLDDEALLEPAEAAMAGGATAERAWHAAAEQVAARYRALDSELLRERAVDVLDVGRRVVGALTGAGGASGAPKGVVIAGELTPADAAALDPDRVLGIATAHGTATAHAAILAQALGLPAVVGLGVRVLGIAEGDLVLLDGEAGTLVVQPTEDVVRDAEAVRARATQRRAVALRRAGEPGATADGTRIEVFANLGSAAETARAVELGSEGVGLLRTEFLFLDRTELPSEDEQAHTLREIANALAGRTLIVRTLDAGADKPLPALPMPPEANPFLGVRGIRLCLQRPEVLGTQFRAILHVAAEHPLKVMLPMVATAEEIRAARSVLDRARADTGIDAQLELGIMVEVPAAALRAGELAEEAEFFSIGTNDLTQYTMAAERGDERLAPLLSGPQPAVLRLVKATVDGAASRGRMVGVCGELAGDPAVALLLVGLGVGELSMTPVLVPDVKAALRAVGIGAAREAAHAALRAADAAAAHAIADALLR